jgi:hypothetical protein
MTVRADPARASAVRARFEKFLIAPAGDHRATA